MTTITRRGLIATAAGMAVATQFGQAWGAGPQPWLPSRANQWYQKQPWLVGCNFVPSTASNQLEMFQAETFDPVTIERELGWAAAIGMNTTRVFLHNLLWQQDAVGFKARLNQFLSIADSKGIRPTLVLFDSVWDPFPKSGPQQPPIPGVHNSRWVQAPGDLILQDPSQYATLQAYVQDVVWTFRNDARVLFWDLWNEPDNPNTGNFYTSEEPKNKVALVTALLPSVFQWARAASPSQPLTSGIWEGDWSSPTSFNATQTVQVTNSDIITFHNYGFVEDFEQRIVLLKRYGRPVICTEYMSRTSNSLFDTCLPVAQRYRVGAINWGCVSGKTQTILPWDSWLHPYTTAQALGGTSFDVVIEPGENKWPLSYKLENPVVWQHDIFHPNGKPYRTREADLIYNLTSSSNG